MGGVAAVVAALNELTGVFGLSQIVWFACMGIVMLRDTKGALVQTISLNAPPTI
jgi:hypothetical protein